MFMYTDMMSKGLSEVAHVIDGALKTIEVRVGGVGLLLVVLPLRDCSSSSSVASSASSTCSGSGASWSKAASPSVGERCMENKKISTHTQDLSMEMHSYERGSVSTYPRRP